MALLVLSSASSTMDVAREMLKLEQVNVLSSGIIEPGGVLALDQTDGRGQRGRNWYSRPGESLCVTYLLPIKQDDLPIASTYSLLAGVSVVKALTTLYGHYAEEADEHGDKMGRAPVFGLKWPNDVMLHGKKLGGILVEVVPYLQREMIALVGVGLNIANRRFPPELGSSSTSLVLEGHPPRAAQVIAGSIYDSLLSGIAVQHESGFEATLNEWKILDITVGRNYRIETQDGPGTGIAVGVDADGALIVQTGDGSRVSVRSASAIREIPDGQGTDAFAQNWRCGDGGSVA